MSPSISFASALLLLSSSSSSFCYHSASSSSSSSSSSSVRYNPDTSTTRALASSTTHPNSMSAFRRSSGSPSFTVTTTVGGGQQQSQQQQQRRQTQKRRMSGRHFQLEELEDAETCTTDITLNDDSSITLGITNGPRCIVEESSGSWSADDSRMGGTMMAGDDSNSTTSAAGDDGNDGRMFQMTLKRVYPAGANSNNDDNGGGSGTEWYTNTKSNIGKFTYTVQRLYVGECSVVGGCVLAMNGDIIDATAHYGGGEGRIKVGYFNMIDTTDERIANSMDVSLA